jgi:hypothetical protein
MHKASLTIVATAAVLFLGTPTDRASGMSSGNPAGVRVAANDVSKVERVHCVSGNPHHRIGHRHWSDGCSSPAFDNVNVPMNLFFGWHRSGMSGGTLNHGINPGYGIYQSHGIPQNRGPTQNRGPNPNAGPPTGAGIDKVIAGSRVKF